jgi:hypothetical protein
MPILGIWLRQKVARSSRAGRIIDSKFYNRHQLLYTLTSTLTSTITTVDDEFSVLCGLTTGTR